MTEYTWNAADALALGCSLMLVFREFHPSRRTTLRYALAAIVVSAGLFIAGAPFGLLDRPSSIFGAALQEMPWNFVFAGLLALFLVLGTGTRKTLVLSKTLRFFGRISYGLYLIHPLMFDAYDAMTVRYFPAAAISREHLGGLWILFLVGSSAAVLFAWVSRETLEEFFLSRKERWSAARIPSVATAR